MNNYLQDLKIPKEFHEMLTKEFLTDFFNEVINAFKFYNLKEGKEPQPYEKYSYMDWWIHINLCEIFSDSFVQFAINTIILIWRNFILMLNTHIAIL